MMRSVACTWGLIVGVFVVHGDESVVSKSTLRQRRRMLDMDALLEQVLPTIPMIEQRSLKKSKGEKKKNDCNTGDYLTDLFDCNTFDLSMSMMAPQPSVVLPPVAPSVPSIPTIPIAIAPTSAPFAMCRAQDRSQAVLTTIRQGYPNANTGEAIDWLIFQDPKQLDPCTDDLLQRYAIASLYYSTGGASSWSNTAQWLSGSSECFWNGISCDATESVTSISLRTYHHIILYVCNNLTIN